jgi:hypothetical protein
MWFESSFGQFEKIQIFGAKFKKSSQLAPTALKSRLLSHQVAHTSHVDPHHHVEDTSVSCTP